MPDEMSDFFAKNIYGGGCAVCERPFEEEGFARKAGHCELPGRARRYMFCRLCWETLCENAPTPGGAPPVDPAAEKAARLLGPRARRPVPPPNATCPLCERHFDDPAVRRGAGVILANWSVRIDVCESCVSAIRERGETL